MSNLQRYLTIAVTAAVLLFLALQSDYLVAGSIPQIERIEKAARVLSFVGEGFFLIPVAVFLYLAGLVSRRNRLTDTGRISLYSVLVSGILVNILKAAFERPRIAHAADSVLTLLEHPSLFDLAGRFNSFPSGHTTVSFAMAMVLAKRYPGGRHIFYLTAALVGASRVWLGSHYPSDVMAGALLGLGVGHLLTTRMRIKEKWQVALLALLIIFISFFKSGSFLLFDVDEAVFSEASREMVETGDYITPTYNYEPRYDKPILIYWLMSAAYETFGVNEFSARFTSSLFGALLVLMTFAFIRHLKGALPAFFVAAALLLNIEYFVYTHSAVTDMTLGFFIAASVYSFYLAVHDGNKRWYTGFWAAAALAVLTKGVVGLLFPLAVAFLFLLATQDLKRIRELFGPLNILLFFAVSVPWFAAEFYVNGWEFFDAFIIKHHIQRYSGVISSHGGPLYYYIIVLLIGFFPWVAFLPGSVYRGIKWRHKPQNNLFVFASVWFLFVLVFFTISRTKLPNYIFPLFPSAAILAGLTIAELAERNPKASKRGLYLMALLSLAMGAAVYAVPFMEVKMDVAYSSGFFFTAGVVFVIIGALSAIAFVFPLPSFTGIAVLMAVLVVFLRVAALPPVNLYLQKTLYLYSTYAKDSLGKDDVLATYEINKPSIAFYAGRKVVKIEKAEVCNIKEYAKRARLVVITSPSKYDELKEYQLKVLDSTPEYMLLATDGLASFSKR
ncbi:MAG: phosphatase PAP2 family protein [Deltaproteobacteria bacterium]|nr:phosphatase PAP2 family protein [Deltaproteobacteria bacterium]